MADDVKIDIYKCFKIPLKKIAKDEEFLKQLNEDIIRMNKITIHAYQFLGLYLRKLYKDKSEIPLINKEFMKLVIKTVSKGSNAGPKTKKAKNLGNKNKLVEFYNTEFKDLVVEKQSKIGLNQTISYMATSILTAFNNNIKIHFFNRLFRFVNATFFNEEQQNIDKLKGDEKKKYKMELRKELKKVKNDLINNTLTSDKKYHKWITTNRALIIPKKATKSVPYDVEANPSKYLFGMFYMNKCLEKMERKCFQPVPLRNDIIPKHMTIDTSALIELYMENQNKYKQKKGDVEKNKDFIWAQFFNMTHPIFDLKKKDMRFNYQIMTDGVSCSVQYVRNEYYGKREVRQKKDKKKIEFPYIDEIPAEEFEKMKSGEYKTVYIDPGKKNLLFMIDDEGKTFTYTVRQRLKQTQRIKHRTIVNKEKNKNGIKVVETELSEYNSKSTDYEKFKAFVKKKNECNEKLFDFYKKELFRKLKLREYINKQRSEMKLMKNIKNRFKNGRQKICLFIGNWCVTKQMKNFISTPQIGMKRLLKKYFRLVTVDEYRTSCLDYEKEMKVTNLEIEGTKLHSVLVFKTKNGSTGCMNRDLNGVRNIRKVTQQYLIDKTRPMKFRRDIQLDEIGNIKQSGG